MEGNIPERRDGAVIREVTAADGATIDAETIERDFPSVSAVDGASMPSAFVVDAAEWSAPSFDPFRFDAVFGDGPERVAVLAVTGYPGEDVTRCAWQVLTRYQAFVRRTNDASATAAFAALLRMHREAHDLSLPLVRADWVHALDVWQWTLRLEPAASLAVQAAALLHDIERLASESHVRIEQHAPDYRAYKAAHAREGARMALELLSSVPLEADRRGRILRLVAEHETPGHDAELALLNDADALSFFSLNSGGFLSYYGEAHTHRKIEYTLARMRPAARAVLPRLRMRGDFERLLHEHAPDLRDGAPGERV